MSEIFVNLLSPYNTVWVKDFSFKERRLELISFMFSRWNCLSCIKFRQWRRKYLVVSVSLPQSQIRFNESQKLWRNLCSRRWLKPTLYLARKFKPKYQQTLKILLEKGLINFKIHFLNTGYEGGPRILRCNLFHSIIADGKYTFFKMLWLTFIKGTFFEFHVEYVIDGLGIKLKNTMGFHILLFSKKVIIYGNIL